MAFKLILEVPSELSGGDTEQVLDEVACKADSLVGVVIFVVRVSAFYGHFKNLADDSTEVDRFLFSVLELVAKVGEEFTVEELANAGFSVFLLLSCGEFLFEPLVAFFGRDDFVLFVVVHFVDVGHDELERVGVSGNGLENMLIVFDAQGAHE